MSALRIVVLAMILGAAVLLRGDIGPLAAAAVWAACLLILLRSAPNRLLSLAPLYLLLLGMFHLGLVVPLRLGLVAIDPPDWVRSPQLATSLWLFTMAAAAFALGARLRLPVAAGAAPSAAPVLPELFWTGMAVTLAGSAMLWVGIYKSRIFDTTYFGTYERAVTEDFRLYLFGRMIVPIGLLVAAAGATRRQLAALGVIFLAVLGPLFFHGVRGPTILHAASLLAVWAVKDGATARRIGVVLTAIAIALVPVIRVTRDIKGASVTSKLADFDPMDVLVEAGGSMYPVVVTAEQVESGRERLWKGHSYRQGAEHVLLNVSSQRSRSDSHDLYPNAWATRIADESLFDVGGGIGYSAVAEPYLNFGPAGVVIFFLVLGAFIGACERWLSRDPFRAAVGASTFGFVLWTVRDDSVAVPRAFVLACAVVFAAWLLKRAHRRRETPVAGAVERRLVGLGEDGG